MTQKNETKLLLLSLLVTGALLGGGVWWFTQKFNSSNSENGLSSVTSPDRSNSNQTLDDRFSSGERLLISSVGSPQKQQGVEAIASGNFPSAVTALQASLQAQRNDPEALIYLNNARIGTSSSYNIAVAIPLGTDLDGSQEILRGVAQAQNTVNQSGGINGVPLKVIIVNDDNDPEIAQQVAKKLGDNSEILGVVGHWASDVSLGTAPIYEEKKLVAISPISTSVKLSGIGRYVFRTIPSDRFAGSALARFQVNQLQKRKTAVFFNSNSNYSKSLKDEFTTALFGDGGEVIAEFDLARPNFNAATDLQQARQQGAEVLMLATSTATLDQSLQVIQVNDGQLALLGGDDVYTPRVLQIGGRGAVGMVLAIPWHILANPQAEFPRTASQLWGGEVSWRSAMAYDATKALIAAIGQNSTRDGVQVALSSPGFKAQGAAGDVQFLPSGDRNKAVQLVKIEPGTRSGFQFDFVPVK
jgi:branched-chain amino acid transport system substrate-binding protein